jgi:hypothetical protein
LALFNAAFERVSLPDPWNVRMGAAIPLMLCALCGFAPLRLCASPS